MAESVLRIVIDSRNAERNARNVANELQNIERNGDYASRSMDSMSVATRSLVGYMGGLVTIGAAISKMDAYTGLQNRLKLVTDSQAELNTAMSDTFGIAQKTASSWDSVAMVYQRFADNADRLNITMAQTSALTETVSKAISVSGGSAASAEAALMQFGQALASGVLRGEEFNSIAEQAPGLLKAIAFGLNTNVGSLRAMAQDGKITGDVLVDALGKAKPYIDDLFNRTDFTISQSFTKLSNEVTKFVGEAGKGSGAASALGDSIGFLANNLSTIADIAIVGGVAMLTKAILTQTVATYGSITASVARRAADIAVLQSQVQLAVVEAQRTRNKVGELAAEQNLIVAKLRTNLATKERIALETRATQVAIQLAVAERNMTAATAQRTIAQNTLNASMSAGSRILGLVGGWTGVLTIGVAALAAGYMYLKNRTAEANAKLEEQGKVAEKTNEELTKLSGNDKKNAVSDLTAAFNAQNAELSKSKEAVDAVLFAIRASSVENEKARKVTEDAKNGVISYNQAIELLNKMDISPELYEMLKKTALQYDENSNKAGSSQRVLKILGVEFKLAGNAAQNAANQVKENSIELNKNETAAEKAARAQKQYAESLSGRTFDAVFTKNLLANNLTEGQTNALLEAANYARKQGVEFTKAMALEALRLYNLEKANKDTIEAKNEAEKKVTKEKEKQAKLAEKTIKSMTIDSVIAKGEGNYNSVNLGKKYGYKSSTRDLESMSVGQVLSAQQKKEFNAAGKYQVLPSTLQGAIDAGIVSIAEKFNADVQERIVQQYLLTAKKGRGNVENYITGKSDNLTAANLDLSKEFASVASPFTGKSYHGGVANNKARISVDDAQNALKASRELYAQAIASGKSAQDAWKAAFNGSISFVDGSDLQKDLDKFVQDNLKKQEEIKQLQSQYDTEAVARSKARDEEILQATILSQNDLIPKIKERYDAQDKLAKLQQEFDVEGHKWTEERKLQYTYDTNVLRLTAEGKFSEDQKKIFEKGYRDQYQQELGYIKLAQETQLFQAKQAYMHEVDLMQERYRLEMQEIDKIADVKQRAAMREATAAKYVDDYEKKRKTAQDNLDSLAADLTGQTELYALQKQLEDREAILDEARKYGLIKEEEYKAALLQIEEDYKNAKLNLQLDQAQQVTGALSGMFSAMLGESSSAYRALYEAQRSFALAQAGINIWKSASDAYANEPGTVWQKIGAAAKATLDQGTFVAMIQAATPKGFEIGGYTGSGGRKDVAGVVHGQEYVLNAAATKRVGVGTLDAINSGKSLGGGDVVNAPITVHVSVQSNGDSSVDSQGQSKQLGQMIGNAVRTVIRQEQRQGGLLAK